MRELNFSIPSGNKACVSINQNLYDRRALDTTSTLPLINSLNHLTYLTTSSARIRDILTIDGGVERLITILKQGRCTKDAEENWKWNLCFQCVVNIGVRGSENVRTRVVEADVVPVVATLLDNYIQIVDKCRERADQEVRKSARSSRHKGHDRHTPRRLRNGPPPPIEIPTPQGLNDDQVVTPGPVQALSSPPERTTFRGHSHQQSLDEGSLTGIPSRASPVNPPPTAVPMIVTTQDSLRIRPVRDIDRLPSMFPNIQGDFNPPESPTTPNGVLQLPDGTLRASPSRTVRRPSIRHQLSISNQSDIMPVDDSSMDGSADPVATADVDNDIPMQDMNVDAMDDAGSPVRLELDPTQQQENLELREAMTDGLNEVAEAAQNGAVTMSPMQGIQTQLPLMPMQLNPYHRYIQERSQANGIISSMPRDEDIIMSLQLLAYVSKYCSLRSYFHNTHLVPRLKTSPYELALLDGVDVVANPPAPLTEMELEEYIQPDDYNIFPLVEMFTVRHHAPEMQYWARVVMRNLCRKDDSKGGVRQCAYYQCGKWEQYTREFAKCRRCRRTKYCSKECQKNAWVFHRHWCVEAQQ
jgi:hypothetical protein